MQEIKRIRYFEVTLIVLAISLYAMRQLWLETVTPGALLQQAKTSQVAAQVLERDLAGYDPIVNATLPLVAGALLLLAAWLVFHYLAFPQTKGGMDGLTLLLSWGLTVLLIGASVYAYYYLKLYIRFRYDTQGIIIGLKVYSLYRKRMLLSEVIGIGILFTLYELASQFYYYLHQQLSEAYGRYFRYGSYVLLALTGTLVLSLALWVQLPATLWQTQPWFLLLVAGVVVQTYGLQNYLYQTRPFWQTSLVSELLRKLLVYLLLGLAGTLLLWGAYGQWQYSHLAPILVLFTGTVLGSASMVYLRRTLLREHLELQTQVSSKSAELESLRAQINPHFLFNALNTLYATALKENSEQTAEGIQKLGEMMRFMLEENHQQYIPLRKEVEYLHNYIQIQRMRLDESQGIEVRVNLEPPDEKIQIAPMLLSPFVENAFKHGISLQNPSWIYITLTLDETNLYFKVHNSLHPKTGSDPEATRAGVGQENVKKRLELIYPDRHHLHIQQSRQDYFVSLTLQY